jgi:DMSO reductase anchor subunit
MSIEWALVFFTLFAGLAVGTFTGVTVTEWRGTESQVRLPGAILTLAALVISGISSVLHLGHPERIFGALGHPTSGIFLEALFMGLFGLLVIFYLMALQRKASDASRKFLATLGVIPATLLAFAVGYTYVMPSRPAWNTMILPLLYLVSAAIMGCFSIAMLRSRTKDAGAAVSLRKITMTFLGIQAILTVAYVGHLALAPYPDATRSAARILSGDLALLFWAGLVLIGLLAPMLIMLRAKKAGAISGASAGLLCVLIAGIAFRVMMFSLGSGVRYFF